MPNPIPNVSPNASNYGERTYLQVIQPVLTLLPHILVLLIRVGVLEQGLDKLSAIIEENIPNSTGHQIRFAAAS
jgi:hypothetical protein